MNQILYMKDIEDNNIHPSKAINHKNIAKKNKSIRLISFLPAITLIPLLFISMNIYASVNKGNNTNNNILSVSETNQETDNVEEIQEDVPTIIDNNTEDMESNIENKDSENNNPSKSATYTTSNGEKYDVIATLNIPSLGIEYPVLSSTSTELLKIALNKYWGAAPNQVGNMVIVGHNYKNTKFFSKLPNIQIGSIVKITDTSGITLDYKVYKTDVIDPYDNSCTSQLTNGHTEITLITCYNNGKQRFIAKARAN